MEEHFVQRKNLRLKEYDYSRPGYYFVTVCANRRKENVFCSLIPVGAAAFGGPDRVETRLTPAGEIIDQLIQNIDSVYPFAKVDTYCVMPDHIHLLLSIEGPSDTVPKNEPPEINREVGRRGRRPLLPMIVNSLKGLSVKRFGHPLWQRGYYEHVIRNDEDLAETRRYIQNNPLKLALKDSEDKD